MNTEKTDIFPYAISETIKEKETLTREATEAWGNFNHTVFKESALSEKTK